MEDTIIGFKTAKLAKKKGFDVSCYHAYDVNNKIIECTYSDYTDKIVKFTVTLLNTLNSSGIYNKCYLAPPQSLVQKWLREEHKLDVIISRYKSSGYGLRYIIYIFNKDNEVISNSLTNEDKPELHLHYKLFRTYEEALESGLQEALKLIKT